jgi:hypothetical protein
VFFALAMIAAASPRAAADPLHDPMKFTLVENGEDRGTWIAAVGTITADTPAEFRRFAKTVQKGLWIEFHSPGGKILPAFELGDLIREGGFNTDVARTVFGGTGKSKLSRGGCFSACAYAFLGGVRREIREESILGFHHFIMNTERPVDANLRNYVERMMARYHKDYLERMDVDTGLYSISSAMGKDEYYEPKGEERFTLRILTTEGVVAEPGASAEPENEPQAIPEPEPDTSLSSSKRSDANGRGLSTMPAVRSA